MKSLLPDRERRHLLQFHIAPRLSYGTRLIVALVLIVAGLGVQYAVLPGDLGLALMACAPVFAGNLFLLLKGYDLKARGATGGEWERTTLDRFDEAFHHDAKVKKWDSNFADVTCGLGCFSFLLFVIVPVVVLIFLMIDIDEFANYGTQDASAGILLVLLVDVLVLIVPHWVTGVRKKWMPAGLLERIRALRVALDHLQKAKSPPCQIQPMMRVVKKGDRQVPTDARAFIRFPDGPEDFLGLQFQVAINMVQGTRFPYLYAVLVAKKEFSLLKKHLKSVEALCEGRNITVESKREKDVDVIVVRQHTTKKSGYHTNDAAVARLTVAAWKCVTLVLGAQASPANSP